MGVVVGLGVGLGLVLVFSAFAVPREVAETGVGARARDHGRLARLLAESGSSTSSPAGVVVAGAASALAAGAVVLVLTATPTIAATFALLAAGLPIAVLAGRARRRRRELAEVWPDAVDNLASAVRAGLALPEALAGLADRGPEQLRPAFAAFAADYQATGRFEDSLDRLKLRLADGVGDRVVEGLRIAREVGGSELGRLLRNLSGYLRDDLRTRAELEARQSWAVASARLAVAAPWVVLLLMSGQREVVARYQSPAGAIVLAVGAALCVLAYRTMLRIGRLPEERRVLT
ncbi:type II secretion system F family protein [Nocardioides sp. R-C-SC26]|uniref:type II secretion system F family protein n=1 Tax=Nocardioides sp. R-C-SC26 TaxID=2870414 RepID=UPI001E4F4727|nr:type II secretion system F family protein [Nocardioides sp. R-C-SC26]